MSAVQHEGRRGINQKHISRIDSNEISTMSTRQKARRHGPPLRDECVVEQSSPERENRKAELHKRAKDTVSRIHKLQEEHDAGKGKRGRDSVASIRSRSSMSSLDGRRRQGTPEYDPENPFDDRKEDTINEKRLTKPVRQSHQHSPQKQVLSSDPVRHLTSRGSPKSTKVQTESAAVKQDRPSRIRTGILKLEQEHPDRLQSLQRPSSASKASSDLATQTRIQDRTRLRRRQTTAEVEKVSEKVGQTDSSVRTLSRSQEEKSHLPQAPIGLQKLPEEKREQGLVSTAAIQNSPSKYPNRNTRRKTESYATPPSERKDSSPSALSKETVQALASLERTLERLKSLSPENRRQNENVMPRRDVIPDARMDNFSSRPRLSRALSPSKEMREVEKERQSTISTEHENRVSKRDDGKGPRPRSSFLARVEKVRNNSAETVENPEDEKIVKEKILQTLEIPRAEVQTQTAPVVKRRSFYTYTPPMLVEKGQQYSYSSTDDMLGGDGSTLDKNTSASSIKIGDESVDDLVRSHGMEEDGKIKQFLLGLRILVDVRDQDGDDAGAMWMEKLRSVGAKVYSKPPQVRRKSRTSLSKGEEKEENLAPGLDFIIYKHGKPATLHYYRSQIEVGRQPIIVGVNWILHCLREGRKVDERDYLVEVAKHPVFTKRRLSMTPKRAPNVSSPPSSKHLDAQGSVEQEDSFDQQGLSDYQPSKLADLLAKKKLIQNAPVRPSPLASRCWNLEASTNSTISTATTMTNHTLNMNNTANLTTHSNMTNFWT